MSEHKVPVMPESLAYVRFVNDDDDDLVSAEMARFTEPNVFTASGADGTTLDQGTGLSLAETLSLMVSTLTGGEWEVTIRPAG